MTIFEKLLEVRKSVPYLQKDAKGYQFNYVSSSKTLGALREKMDEMQLLIVPRVLRVRVSPHTTSKGGQEYFTELWVHFTIINAEKPEERIKCPWYGQGLDSGEKGVGKSLTYAEKYFLLKLFNIATDKDDPDAFQGKGNDNKGKAKPPKADPMTAPQKKKIEALIKESGFEREVFKGLLISAGEIQTSLSDITKTRASEIIDKWDAMKTWANGQLDKLAQTGPPEE